MSELNDALLALQEKVAEHLKADPYFAGIDVLTERKGDIRQGITAALNKLGLGVAVVTPGLKIQKRLGTRIIFEVTIVIEFAEIVITNQSAAGTKKPALAAALTGAMAIDSKPNGRNDRLIEDETSVFLLDPETTLQIVPDKSATIYHVVATTLISLSSNP